MRATPQQVPACSTPASTFRKPFRSSKVNAVLQLKAAKAAISLMAAAETVDSAEVAVAAETVVVVVVVAAAVASVAEVAAVEVAVAETVATKAAAQQPRSTSTCRMRSITETSTTRAVY